MIAVVTVFSRPFIIIIIIMHNINLCYKAVNMEFTSA